MEVKPFGSEAKDGSSDQDANATRRHAAWLTWRFGLCGPDSDDVQQQLEIALWCRMRKCDLSLASRTTFRERILTWECQLIARKIQALRRRDARVAEAVRELARRRGDGAKSTVERDLSLRSALASLNDRQRQIGHGLLAGESISAIARRLGVHRATVHRDLVEVRAELETAGLRDFAS